ncbi:MAG TPA: hypothetical protein VGQ03_04470 [Nitrososphaera sp.]|nr:hypothetical protein [Nitrososphaera sp.]
MSGKCKLCTTQTQVIEFNGRALCTVCFASELESIEDHASPRRNVR